MAYVDGIEARTTASSSLMLVRGPAEHIKELPIEDGRVSFATDTKRLYLDCNFTDSEGTDYAERLMFGGGGNNGIFYGMKEFSTDQIENNDFTFEWPHDFDDAGEDLPTYNALIINIDGCIYRINDVAYDESDNLILGATRMTLAGGGGGGGGPVTGIQVARDPNQNYNIILANGSIPVGFKVTDSVNDSTIDVQITINGVIAGTQRRVLQGEYTSIDLYRYREYFVVNNSNNVMLRFTNEYEHAAQLTIRDIRIIDMQVVLSPADLGTISATSARLNIKPYGAGNMYERWINLKINEPNVINTRAIQLPFDSVIDNGEIFTYDIDLTTSSIGSYSVEVWLTARANEGDTEILTSPKAIATFDFVDASLTVPIVSINTPALEFSQYDTVTLTYRASYSGSSTPARLMAYYNGELIQNIGTTVVFNTTQQWHYTFERCDGSSATYKFVISLDEFELSSTTEDITVRKAEIDPPSVDLTDSSLQLALSAVGRSNSETNPATWTYKTVNCQFENFNWSNNGWITDDNQVTSLHLTNGAKLTIPFAPFSAANTQGSGARATGKTIEIIYKLSNVRDDDGVVISAFSDLSGVGIVGTGTKICMNTENLRNYHTPEEEVNVSEGERAATNGLRAYITSDERIHVAFAIQSVTDNPDPLIYTYVNGVLSGLVKYGQDAIRDVMASNIIIDSTTADIDLYGIRVYGKYSADSILLNNYAADLPSVEDRILVQQNNNVLNSGEISLALVQELGNIPYIVFTDGRKTGDKKGTLFDSDGNKIGTGPELGSTYRLPVDKKDFRWCPCYFVDPEHPDRSFGDANNLVEAVLYAQGTSSLAYPVKNLRIRFVKKGDAYSLLPSIPIAGLDSPNPEIQAAAEAEQERWKHLPAVQLFTLKTDYMDSSMAHNTGTGNVLGALYDSIGLKNAAQLKWPNKTLVNNVVGFPIIAFYKEGTNPGAQATYIGRYNFDLDKAEHALFGFTPESDGTFGRLVDSNNEYITAFQATTDESKSWDSLTDKVYYTQPNEESIWSNASRTSKDMKNQLKMGPLYEKVVGPTTIQCWEFLNNAAALCGFREAWDEATDVSYKIKQDSSGNNLTDGNGNPIYETDSNGNRIIAEYFPKWTGAFESRYPEFEAEQASDKRAFSRLINWLASTDQSKATNQNLAASVTFDGIEYSTDTAQYRLAKFKNEFNNYMEKSFTIFYYIITEMLLMIDSRAKNMMMCSFDIDVANNTGHWFPIFYDMDTILGVDNTGFLRYEYDVADENENGVYNASANYGYYNSNGDWVPNAGYSTLWANLREAFFEDIKTMYNNLRQGSKFNVDFLLQSYNNSQANAWAEIYDNKDAWYKYIRPLTEDVYVGGSSEATHGGIDFTAAAQGTRSLHREYLLTHRMQLLDSKYSLGTSADIVMRVHDTLSPGDTHPNPHCDQFLLTSSSTQYASARWGKNANMVTTPLAKNKPTWTPKPGIDTTKDLETYLYDLNDVYDIGDMSDKFMSICQFNKSLRLRRLQLGNGDPSYASAYTTSVSGLDKLTLLEEIDLQNGSFTGIDLSNCKYLRNVYAKGSNLTVIPLAEGSNIQHLELPAATRELTLRNMVFYDTKNTPSNLQIENYRNMISLYVSGCPLVNTQTIIENVMRDGGQLLSVRLIDVDWVVNVNDSTTIFETDENDQRTLSDQDHEIVTDLKILDYMYNITSGLQDDPTKLATRQSSNNLYFTGRVLIKNTGYAVNDYNIKQKYSRFFPNLEIVYEDNSDLITGYEIIIHTGASTDGKDIATSTDEYQNSIVLGADAFAGSGFAFRDYLTNNVASPIRASTVSTTYTFRGWVYTDYAGSWDASGQPKAIITDDQTVLKKAFAQKDGQPDEYVRNGIKMSNGVPDTWCPEYIGVSAFTNRQLHLYPVYEAAVRKYDITFMFTEEDVSPAVVWRKEKVPYGSEITPPSQEPALIDMTVDPALTTIRRVTNYTINGYTYQDFTVTGEMTFYPVYGDPEYMNNLINPHTGYFDSEDVPDDFALLDTSTFTFGGNDYALGLGVCVVIKEDFALEAITIPALYNGVPVVSFKNRSTAVKRIFFEPGCPIRFLMGEDTGLNGTIQSSSGPVNNGLFDGMNEVLEYVDLAALTQLHTIGAGENANLQNGEGRTDLIFANCSNLTISGLPDSLTVIGYRSFANDPKVTFSKLPENLLLIGTRAFENCTGLTTIDFSSAKQNMPGRSSLISMHNQAESVANDVDKYWPKINDNAFYKCSNLNFGGGTNNENAAAALFGFQAIGTSAFAECSKLEFKLSSINGRTHSLKSIGNNAFQKCTKLGLTILPTNLEKIGNSAFANCGTLNLASSMPEGLRSLGSLAFSGDSIVNDNQNALQFKIMNLPVGYDDQIGSWKQDINIANNALSGLHIGALQYSVSSAFRQANPDINVSDVEPWKTGIQTGFGADIDNVITDGNGVVQSYAIVL